MPRKVVFMFPGQGSQYFHMGRALYQGNETFHGWMLRLDAMVAPYLGCSVLDELYSDERAIAQTFDRTLLTHPAIFMVEYALARTLSEAGLSPDLTMGLSVGSAAAAAVSGHLDTEEAVCLVMRQAESIENNCEPGGMLTVIKSPELFGERFLSERSELAGVNLPEQFVVSGTCKDLGLIEQELRRRRIDHQRLPVAFAFHSHHIDAARQEYFARTGHIRFHRGGPEMMCCERAELVSQSSCDHLWRAVRNPTRFAQAALELERDGPNLYVDVGPSGTLATFLKSLLPPQSRSRVRPALTPLGKDLQTFSSAVAERVD